MIHASGVTKTYSSAHTSVQALVDIHFSIDEGDFVVIHGSSGCGKTTLLLTLGGMLRPTSGTVSFKGNDVYSMSTLRRSRYRRRSIGFIFQKFFLVPYLTAYDNIRIALGLRGYGGDCKQKIVEIAARLGMVDRLSHRPPQLSVGEQQRIAMARAIAAEPQLILADEPTGNLDRSNAQALADFLTNENRGGRTIVLVTHDETLLDLGNRTVQLNAGRLSTPANLDESSSATRFI